jgi:hypothetical protein
VATIPVAAKATPGSAPQFEYRVMNVSGSDGWSEGARAKLEARLNALGREGFALISYNHTWGYYILAKEVSAHHEA